MSKEHAYAYEAGYQDGLRAASADLKAENAKLRRLCKPLIEYVSQDRCEGCVCKSRCNDGQVDECWMLAEIREIASELGMVVDK